MVFMLGLPVHGCLRAFTKNPSKSQCVLHRRAAVLQNQSFRITLVRHKLLGPTPRVSD